MVFYSFVLVMKPRQRRFTSQALREIGVAVYSNGGLIRSITNEGIMRPYSRFRDADNTPLTYARYIILQLDMGEEEMGKVDKIIREHQDVLMALKLNNLERPVGIRSGNKELQAAYFPLDTFTRLEEEINWSPQTSADIYTQLEMNWKEFSRTRWSSFLRN
ncbi:hypothetical protein, conserved [Trypanosoma brucei gambiense DAL972]|uniref:Uncharacterized protein n=2 Tax=Trypanosoma brucei TaxID=5691 RepID=Q38BW5_TRYB2|nr:hypothetical protein, conserved [Trypanosoma brucei gambiense DAL972]XP_822533.1 hypothetical protein, conserved [Trypanosoma brucei brucei TREU927]6HIV_CF Chain CF, bS6m [Trypanosoma brucei brucei]6HIW_CF Chain CF, bS6m [Trypanosoma brucei brucei]6HIY_CF Chain CF, bS6m [Trypanosoma brucei brucei]6SGA_CF Chain CF, bS6m [Trypanosoma brucei brucei]6SGB_CF Chain CF, bS6m [Trypanosoma brucei brucei]7PUA_CF Chain CF, bS6m [Trypanosoma brucei brucei]7PUB_CF Chain CF, bS6m [Trypanosoma brucei b|eukprot:XP_011777530.1 hypothetical protein, conserved [Trypanosoma brucei gambiense DAL972]